MRAHPVGVPPSGGIARPPARNFWPRHSRGRMDAWDACPQTLKKHTNRPSKHPDAYPIFDAQQSQTPPSTVQEGPPRATFCPIKNSPPGATPPETGDRQPAAVGAILQTSRSSSRIAMRSHLPKDLIRAVGLFHEQPEFAVLVVHRKVVLPEAELDPGLDLADRGRETLDLDAGEPGEVLSHLAGKEPFGNVGEVARIVLHAEIEEFHRRRGRMHDV